MCFKAFAFRSKHDEELTSLWAGHSCKCEAITSHVLTSPFDELALNELATSVKMYIRISLQQLPAHCRSRAMASIALVRNNKHGFGNNTVVGFNNRFLQLVGHKRPTTCIWKFIKEITSEEFCLRTLIQQDAMGEPPRKRQKKVFET